MYIGHQWPEPRSSAAGERTVQLLLLLQSMGLEVHFGSAAERGPLASPLETRGISCHPLALNCGSFDLFLKEHDFDLIVFDRFLSEEQFGWRVHQHLPGCRTILDTQDLHSLRYSREATLRKGEDWSPRAWIEEPAFYREVASIFRTDLTLLISRTEQRLLLELLPMLETRCAYLPFCFEAPQTGLPGFEARRDFVLAGNGKHPPNRDAAHHLVHELWPLIRRELPGAELHLYGAYLPAAWQQWEKAQPGVKVKGHCEALLPRLQGYRAQLAPLRFGAGVKGKLLSALQAGLPTLTTAVGAEDVFAADGFLAASDPDFIAKAIALYQDPKKWEAVLREQTGAAAGHFSSPEAWAKKLREILLSGGHASPDSQADILSRLLRHRAFDSYRYLSRWITEKNKGGGGSR
ncbi:glycosyltransferase [Robiginitalea sp. M366]|uniref:glycosyltransferase n=1 Tax=Robiginitalea aestuariiviva TaxID=3036903 RepID=UPI00240D9266|nr:glycosyltransferase [Robiginitalea aestuariiviva]MDG1572934.1 glycosyltransferase [Robiginitalea aestuariiviva]